MSLAIRRQVRAAWLPTQTNRATEFSIPHPSRVSRQTRHRATVRQGNGRPFGFSIDLLSKEAISILGNSGEMFAGGLRSTVVRRPSLLERMNIARQVLRFRPNQFHRLS